MIRHSLSPNRAGRTRPRRKRGSIGIEHRTVKRRRWGAVLESEAGATMNLSERITIDPAICHGKPTIRGLRYTVETILELLSSGMEIDAILADYEDLEREDILAALDYARRLTQINRMIQFQHE